MNKEMIHECSVQVRSYECDSYGHVNNANYLNYLEFARYEYIKAAGFDYLGMIEAGYGLYVARIEIDYKKAAITDDALIIRSRAIKKGTVSGVIAQRIRRGQDLIVEAKVTWAFVDSQGMPARMPERWDMPGLQPDPADPEL